VTTSDPQSHFTTPLQLTAHVSSSSPSLLVIVGNCGGAGICGTCAVKVLSGGEFINPPSKNEQNTLKGMMTIYALFSRDE